MIKQPLLTLLLLSAFVAGCSNIQGAQEADQLSRNKVTQGTQGLTWLTGCWIARDDAATYVEETWRSAARGTLLFGYSVTMKKDVATFYELLSIKRDASGWILSAYPKGVGPTDFTGTITGPSTVRFDNESNDYPQRITYERVGDKLNAQISMTDGSQVNRWHYERCTAGS